MGSFNSKAELSHLFRRSVCSICVCMCAGVFLEFVPDSPFFTLKAYFIILTAYCLSIPLCYVLIHALLLPSTQTCIFNWMLLQEGRKKKDQLINSFWGTKSCFGLFRFCGYQLCHFNRRTFGKHIAFRMNLWALCEWGIRLCAQETDTDIISAWHRCHYVTKKHTALIKKSVL